CSPVTVALAGFNPVRFRQAQFRAIRQIDSFKPELAGLKIIQRPVTDPVAYKPEGRVAHGRSHSSYLPITTFTDGELEPTRGHGCPVSHRWDSWPDLRLIHRQRFGRAGPAVFEVSTGAERVDVLSGIRALNLN